MYMYVYVHVHVYMYVCMYMCRNNNILIFDHMHVQYVTCSWTADNPQNQWNLSNWKWHIHKKSQIEAAYTITTRRDENGKNPTNSILFSGQIISCENISIVIKVNDFSWFARLQLVVNLESPIWYSNRGIQPISSLEITSLCRLIILIAVKYLFFVFGKKYKISALQKEANMLIYSLRTFSRDIYIYLMSSCRHRSDITLDQLVLYGCDLTIHISYHNCHITDSRTETGTVNNQRGRGWRDLAKYTGAILLSRHFNANYPT